MADVKGFLKYAREGPKRRSVELRIEDWREFYEPISEDKLKAQGARCMDCGVPFCQSNHGCPVEPDPRVERPRPPGPLEGRPQGPARDQQLPRVHGTPVPGPLRVGLRARHQQ